MTNEIIILDGNYEVHPSNDNQTWCVVNGATGQVRCDGLDRDTAVAFAEELNQQY